MVAGSSLVPPEWSSLWRGSIHRGDLARSTGLAFFVTISPQQVTPPYESSRRRSSPIQVTQIHPAYSGANDRVGSRTGPSRTEVTSSRCFTLFTWPGQGEHLTGPDPMPMEDRLSRRSMMYPADKRCEPSCSVSFLVLAQHLPTQ